MACFVDILGRPTLPPPQRETQEDWIWRIGEVVVGLRKEEVGETLDVMYENNRTKENKLTKERKKRLNLSGYTEEKKVILPTTKF